MALSEAFSEFDVRAFNLNHFEALPLLEDADAVLGFGSDASMQQLDAQLAPGIARSLHGSKASLAIVEAADPENTAKGLYLDAAAYDSRGCMSPIAVFCLGESRQRIEIARPAFRAADSPGGGGATKDASS